jgi:hypothetical protein
VLAACALLVHALGLSGSGVALPLQSATPRALSPLGLRCFARAPGCLLPRLRGGGLIKKKSKAGHRVRKAQKKGMWWVDDKMLKRGDKKTQQRDDRVIDAAKSGDANALRQALEDEGDVNARVRQGPTSLLLSTPLHLAAYYGHRDIVAELLAHKCKVNAVNMAKKTALHVAARQGSAEICKILLDAGASPHAEDADGYTPQDDAEVAPFNTEEARQVLQAAGALRHRAYSVLANPGWGGQKARNASSLSAVGAASSSDADENSKGGERRSVDRKGALDDRDGDSGTEISGLMQGLGDDGNDYRKSIWSESEASAQDAGGDEGGAEGRGTSAGSRREEPNTHLQFAGRDEQARGRRAGGERPRQKLMARESSRKDGSKGPRARKRDRERERGKHKFYTKEDGLRVAERRFREAGKTEEASRAHEARTRMEPSTHPSKRAKSAADGSGLPPPKDIKGGRGGRGAKSIMV